MIVCLLIMKILSYNYLSLEYIDFSYSYTNFFTDNINGTPPFTYSDWKLKLSTNDKNKGSNNFIYYEMKFNTKLGELFFYQLP